MFLSKGKMIAIMIVYVPLSSDKKPKWERVSIIVV
jgi:hypothetical protein